MSPSVVVVVSAVLFAVLALASGQTRKLMIGGVEYSSHDLRIDNNAKVLAFYGIPYARQPVGRFRFTRPEPLTKLREWNLREDEHQKYYKTPPMKSKSCPQVDPFRNRFDPDLSTEDCLRVDLYILEDLFNDQVTSSRKYGMSILLEGFDFKSGVAQHLDPAVGAFKDQKDVGVLAVVHYRLGALGFLTTEDDEGPANLGLWDQSEALKFLKEQVVNGAIPQVDQQRISLLGFGSGGIAVSYHSLNPINKPMFSAALISGGSALSPDANIRDARDRAFDFGQHVGCSSGSTRKLINCLRNADIQKIVEIGDGGHFLFGPVVDANHTRDINRAYITDHPQKLLERETFDNVRGIIYGFPKNAASLRYYTQTQARTAPHNGRTSAPVVDNSLDERIKYYLTPFQSHGDTSRALAASLKFLYFRNYTEDEVSRNQTLFDSLMIDALTDYLSVAPVISAAHIHATKKLNQRQSGVYIYYRDAEPELSTFSSKLQIMAGALVKYGTSMDDLLQFVGVNGISPLDSGSEGRLVRVWSTIVSGLFGKVDTEVRDYGGIQDYKPNVPQVYYITALRGKGSIEPYTTKYREPNRIFWSKFVPTIGTILDDISQTSRTRHETSKLYKNTTLGTSIPLALLVVVCICLGALLWRAKRSASSPMSSSVHFQKVSQNDP